MFQSVVNTFFRIMIVRDSSDPVGLALCPALSAILQPLWHNWEYDIQFKVGDAQRFAALRSGFVDSRRSLCH
jgi:hypothetical protein